MTIRDSLLFIEFTFIYFSISAKFSPCSAGSSCHCLLLGSCISRSQSGTLVTYRLTSLPTTRTLIAFRSSISCSIAVSGTATRVLGIREEGEKKGSGSWTWICATKCVGIKICYLKKLPIILATRHEFIVPFGLLFHCILVKAFVHPRFCPDQPLSTSTLVSPLASHSIFTVLFLFTSTSPSPALDTSISISISISLLADHPFLSPSFRFSSP